MNAPLAEPSIRLTGAALPDVQRSITLVRWLAAGPAGSAARPVRA